MSDNAIALICVTIMVLGLLALTGFATWLDSDRASQPQQTKAQRGIHRGTQPDTRPDPLVPPKGGSGTQPKRGEQ